MLPGSLIKGFDKRRLRNLLLLFFLALAIPTAVLIKQAYGQLKWEAFHQHRGQAEELTARIDARLIDLINTADAHTFADYGFLVITGDPAANFLQRSILSNYPVAKDIPGLLGHFQVDADGAFGTPILPSAEQDRQKLGIDDEEYQKRQLLALELRRVLADNSLVRSRPESRLTDAANEVAATRELFAEEEKEATDELRLTGSRRLQSPAAAAPDFHARIGADLKTNTVPKEKKDASADPGTYSQQVFDRLNESQIDKLANASEADAVDFDDTILDVVAVSSPPASGGKVADLDFEVDLQEKNERLTQAGGDEPIASGRLDNAPERARAPRKSSRKERSILPEPVSAVGLGTVNFSVGDSVADRLRINTFQSEIEPLEFSLLDSGHFVLFRKVWRNDERIIQGFVLNRTTFINDVIVKRFNDTALPLMSNLIVAYQGDILVTERGRLNSYPNGNQTMDGALLYRSRLSTPLDSLELIFTISRLPAGPGASVLAWVTVILSVVFAGGFLTLYRLGASQINLARQQQDFVSAISHELKTPLTSIRMYGEMLKEGWADDEKRQSYYEFIHDESERLTRLISNVLQLARITRNEPQFDIQPTSIGGLMSQIESKIANQIGQAGFQLQFTRDDAADQMMIDIDSDCFTQIIINLVDNAIKFSRNASVKRIDISSRLSSDNQVRFTLRDFGPGIPADQMKKIFRLFYRSESELTRETVGTGIGLAIVHQLTLAMGGAVDATNRSPGAEFSVSFPLA